MVESRCLRGSHREDYRTEITMVVSYILLAGLHRRVPSAMVSPTNLSFFGIWPVRHFQVVPYGSGQPGRYSLSLLVIRNLECSHLHIEDCGLRFMVSPSIHPF